jgi:hypothetical protein
VTRREVLARLGAGALLLPWLGPGCQSSRATAAGRTFQFIVVNDLHRASPQCAPYFAALIEQMRGHGGVGFVLLVGDLADDGKAENLVAVRDDFRRLGVPLHPVAGNHDYVTGTDRRAYEEVFPNRINYRFAHQGWEFIGLDSTQGTDYQDTKIPAATLAWLDATLPGLDRKRPTVIFTHFPLGEGVPMRPLNADEVLRRFEDFELRGVFDGHHHAFTLRRFQEADVVTNRCCSRLRGNHDGTKEKGYWLVTAGRGGLTREFVEFKPPGV